MVMEYWTYGEHGEGFGMPSNAFFTAEPTDDIQRLNHAGKSVKWGRSDLKLGKFQFLDFLDCRNISEAADLQFSLGAQRESQQISTMPLCPRQAGCPRNTMGRLSP